jgi:hypothetical protein
MTATARPWLELNTLQRAVLDTIVYSDVFDFALTVEEMQRWLPLPASRDEVEAALRSEALSELLSGVGPYVMLHGREDLAAVRERRVRSSRLLRRRAETYATLIGRLPFVRMVALTGALAVDSSEARDDIDYLIVTAPGRVWLARAATMLVVRLAALRGLTLCPNYVLSESALALSSRDGYTARELLQMRALYGVPVHWRMLEANAWWREFLPNAAVPGNRAVGQSSKGFGFKLGLELLLGGRLGDALERWVFQRKARELRAQSRGGEDDETRFDETMCKGHFDGYRRRTRDAVATRLQQVLSR